MPPGVTQGPCVEWACAQQQPLHPFTHLRQHTQSTGHAEEHCVEALLLDVVVLQQHPAVGVNVGPGVLDLRGGQDKGKGRSWAKRNPSAGKGKWGGEKGEREDGREVASLFRSSGGVWHAALLTHLAHLSEDLGHDLVEVADDLEHRVIGQELGSKLALSGTGGKEEARWVAGFVANSGLNGPRVKATTQRHGIRRNCRTHMIKAARGTWAGLTPPPSLCPADGPGRCSAGLSCAGHRVRIQGRPGPWPASPRRRHEAPPWWGSWCRPGGREREGGRGAVGGGAGPGGGHVKMKRGEAAAETGRTNPSTPKLDPPQPPLPSLPACPAPLRPAC